MARTAYVMGARIRGVLQHKFDEGVSTGKLFGADVDAEGAERILQLSSSVRKNFEVDFTRFL